MITAKTTRGKTMTSVETPNRQLKERDLAMDAVLSAKSFRRVNASPLGRPPSSASFPAGIRIPGRPRRLLSPPAVAIEITTCDGRGLRRRRSDPAAPELVERKVQQRLLQCR